MPSERTAGLRSSQLTSKSIYFQFLELFFYDYRRMCTAPWPRKRRVFTQPTAAKPQFHIDFQFQHISLELQLCIGPPPAATLRKFSWNSSSSICWTLQFPFSFSPSVNDFAGKISNVGICNGQVRRVDFKVTGRRVEVSPANAQN